MNKKQEDFRRTVRYTVLRLLTEKCCLDLECTVMIIINSQGTAMKTEDKQMKKAAIVWSSPNGDGLTASAKDRFAEGLRDAGAEVYEIALNRKKTGALPRLREWLGHLQ